MSAPRDGHTAVKQRPTAQSCLPAEGPRAITSPHSRALNLRSYDRQIFRYGISWDRRQTMRPSAITTGHIDHQRYHVWSGEFDKRDGERRDLHSARIDARACALSGDGRTGAIWNGVTGQSASGGNPATAGDVLSLYTISLFEGGLVPPQVAIGSRLAEILFFGDAPGYPGYFQVNVRVPSSVAPGSAVPVRLTYLGRTSNAVTIGGSDTCVERRRSGTGIVCEWPAGADRRKRGSGYEFCRDSRWVERHRRNCRCGSRFRVPLCPRPV